VTPRIARVAAPSGSRIASHALRADYTDTFEMPVVDASMSALGAALRLASRTPAWIEGLMSVRNTVVKTMGLKNLGSLGAVDRSKALSSYRAGDRVGIFVLELLSEAEVVLAVSDKHLDAKVSVCKVGSAGHPAVAVTTVVHVHNLLGRAYISIVAPVHRLIVPAMLRRLLTAH
jgi:hypothetical protein